MAAGGPEENPGVMNRTSKNGQRQKSPDVGYYPTSGDFLLSAQSGAVHSRRGFSLGEWLCRAAVLLLGMVFPLLGDFPGNGSECFSRARDRGRDV